MIGLVTFLKAAGIEFDTDDLKIHLACYNQRERPIDVYFAGNFKKWQERQGQRNFKCAHVISLIDLGESHWLFAGVYQILGCKPHPDYEGDFLYATKLLPKQDDLIGRIIVHHKRGGVRASYIWHKKEIALTISEIRGEKLTIKEFPGYNAVVLSHSNLITITEQKIPAWHGALANIKGIYLITDTSTGRHYVGKASGKSGIWQRWCSYAENGHGGNKELKKVLKNKGEQHMTHFQYSILEIADTHASDKDILARETYWMNALKSRKFGMN
jgi:hypothetical protein